MSKTINENVLVASPLTEADKSNVLGSLPWNTWVARLHPKLKVGTVIIHSVTYRPPKDGQTVTAESVMFAFVSYLAGSKSYRQYTLLSSDSATILVRLHDEQGNVYAALVSQERPSVGEIHCFETPAGRHEGGTIRGLAITELQEELGITIEPEKLIQLSKPEGVTLSCGILNERLHVFYTDVQMKATHITALQDRVGGLEAEGEHTIARIVPFEALPQSTDSKTLIAYGLFCALGCHAIEYT